MPRATHSARTRPAHRGSPSWEGRSLCGCPANVEHECIAPTPNARRDDELAPWVVRALAEGAAPLDIGVKSTSIVKRTRANVRARRSGVKRWA